MGMYTELVLKCRVSEKAPAEVLAVFAYLFGGGDKPSSLPDHEFFRSQRWDLIGGCCSYYHHPSVVNSYSEGRIFSRSDLKDYGDEIEKFLDWADPYIESSCYGGCLGWSWYEEMDEPRLIYKKGYPLKEH